MYTAVKIARVNPRIPKRYFQHKGGTPAYFTSAPKSRPWDPVVFRVHSYEAYFCDMLVIWMLPDMPIFIQLIILMCFVFSLFSSRNTPDSACNTIHNGNEALTVIVLRNIRRNLIFSAKVAEMEFTPNLHQHKIFFWQLRVDKKNPVSHNQAMVLVTQVMKQSFLIISCFIPFEYCDIHY